MQPFLDELRESVIVLEDTILNDDKESSNQYNPTFLAVINAIKNHPGWSFGELAELESIPVKTTQSISKHIGRAVEEGWVVVDAMVRGKGNSLKIPAFTKEGEERFGKQDLEKCKCGIVCFRWLKEIEAWYEQRKWQLLKEFFLNQHESADGAIIGKDSELLLAVEVELVRGNYRHCISNIEKCLNAGFGKILSMYENKQKRDAAEKLGKELLEEGQIQERVVFGVLTEFLSDEDTKHLLP